MRVNLKGIRILLPLAILVAPLAQPQTSTGRPAVRYVAANAVAEALDNYCTTCHNSKAKTGGVVIDTKSLSTVSSNAETWEKVIRQLRAESMPPPGMPRPDKATYQKLAAHLEGELNRSAALKPNPGQQPNLHRLTRSEYKNAIRDVLALQDLPKEMDFTLLLPADNASSGFDNISDLLYISPATMERYLDAAQKISRLAVGDVNIPLMVNIHRSPLEGPQGTRVEELPLGTRGGMAVKSYFPVDAEYDFQVEMAGGGGGFGGPREAHQLEVTIDGERKHVFTIGGPPAPGAAGGGRRGAAAPTEVRLPVKAGPHLIGITFVQHTEALDEATLRPRMRSRGTQPSVGAVTIRGPIKPTGPGVTPSRAKILTCQPKSATEELPCAKQVLTSLMKHAYRRPSTAADLAVVMPFYDEGRQGGSFDLGIQTALERILVSPQFLYRIERDPATAKAGSSYRLNDLEFASRLSFFLWSSVPDDELLTAATSGRLRQPAVLTQQVRRMMADPRSDSLVNNFAAQWLYLRDIDVKEPDLFLFRDFDAGLRESFERETELFLASVFRENKPVRELLTANYSFLNERLAKHYGIPNIRGSQFRRVTFPAGSPRGGLLGQGGILTLTSYSTRTSPVLRGKYVLENLLASPPPPPPANVPSLKTESKPGEELTLRQAMIAHRANPACAGCHAKMDPIGFAMENFDAVGRWREQDGGKPIDVSSTLVDGTVVNGMPGVKELVLKNPERFVGALTEKLMMYAVGRNVQYFDAPAVRQIVRESATTDYRFESLVLGVVRSTPFQMRTAATEKIAAK